MLNEPILHIAVPSPLRQGFDYLPPISAQNQQLQPGIRIQVPFRNQNVIGILLETRQHSELTRSALKRAITIVDEQPVVPAILAKLATWASNYYQHPIGEVIAGFLPTLLRQAAPAHLQKQNYYRLTQTGEQIDPEQIRKRAPQQAAIIGLLKLYPAGLSTEQLRAHACVIQALKTLVNKAWIVQDEADVLPSIPNHQPIVLPELNGAQQSAVNAVVGSIGQAQAFLLYGVTSSGKTEVYLRIIAEVLAAGRQALVLIPEIGLTPQTVERFQQRFQKLVVVLHSGLSDRERLNAWLLASSGQAAVIIGTRSAIFTPLLRPGIIVIDEEHDVSFKQQEGFRYSARDLALVRGRFEQVPVLLGSATPSLESIYNAQQQRYRLLALPLRAGSAQPPKLQIVDIRNQKLVSGLFTAGVVNEISQHLKDDGQVLLFLNRRGYAPTLLCHQCGWVVNCKRCDAPLTLHKSSGQLHCHHCGKISRLLDSCQKCHQTQLLPVGFGTERLEQFIEQQFRDVPLVRIDRDTTRRKGAMQKMLDGIHSGHSRILLGTQMLAKGHHFPQVTLVVILNADNGLHSVDFRATERLAQLVIQVAGRAGRAERAGKVLIQTHHPDHPLLATLVQKDYLDFANAALLERQITGLSPYGSLALIRAEATDKSQPEQFLQEALTVAQQLHNPEITLLGPAPAPMERRAGRYRYQLLIQTAQRQTLQKWLPEFIRKLEKLKSTRKVRWSVDVDPLDLS